MKRLLMLSGVAVLAAACAPSDSTAPAVSLASASEARSLVPDPGGTLFVTPANGSSTYVDLRTTFRLWRRYESGPDSGKVVLEGAKVKFSGRAMVPTQPGANSGEAQSVGDAVVTLTDDDTGRSAPPVTIHVLAAPDAVGLTASGNAQAGDTTIIYLGTPTGDVAYLHTSLSFASPGVYCDIGNAAYSTLSAVCGIDWPNVKWTATPNNLGSINEFGVFSPSKKGLLQVTATDAMGHTSPPVLIKVM